MNSPIDRRAQTGPLNAALISPALMPRTSAQTAPLPGPAQDTTALRPQDAVTTSHLAHSKQETKGKTAAPVSLEFPSGQPAAPASGQAAKPIFAPILASEDLASVSALYDTLSQSEQSSGQTSRMSAREEQLLNKFGISVDRGRGQLRLESGRVLNAQDIQVLKQAVRMRVAVLSNQANSVNTDFTQTMGMNGPSMEELMERYQSMDQRIKGLAAILENSKEFQDAGLDAAAGFKGVKGLISNASQINDGFKEAMMRVLNGQEIGELDLSQGTSFILAQMLTEKNADKVSGLVDLLTQKASPEGVAGISLAEENQLREFGIGVDKAKGQLINLVTGTHLGGWQIQALRQAAEDRVPLMNGSSGLEGIALDEVSQLASAKLQSAIGNLAQLDTIRSRLNLREANIHRLETNVETSQQNLQRDELEIARIQTLLTDQTQTHETITAVAQELTSPDAEAFIQAQARSGKLPELNQRLAATGLQLGIDAQGQVTYRAQGRPLSRPEFQTQLTDFLAASRTEISQNQTGLIELQRSRSQHIEASTEATTELERETQAHQQDLAAYQDQINLLKTRSLPDLQALKNDPEFWNNQPEDVRRLIDDLLSRADQELSQAPAFVEHHQEVIRQANDLIIESRQVIDRARQQAQATDRLIARLQDLLKRLDQAQPTKPDSDAIEQKTAELIAEAERLFAELTLAAQPGQTPSNSLTQDLLKNLEELSVALKTTQREQGSRDSFQDQIQQAYLEKTRENLHYHLEKLAALASHPSNPLTQALLQAGQQLLPDLRQLH